MCLSPLDSEEIKPVNLKGNQSWIFTGRTEAEAEAPIVWPLGTKNWLIGKDPDAGKDWRQEEKGKTEVEMVEWHHRLDGHEFEWVPGIGDGQESLVCCSPWGHQELDTTEWLNGTEARKIRQLFQCNHPCNVYFNKSYWQPWGIIKRDQLMKTNWIYPASFTPSW